MTKEFLIAKMGRTKLLNCILIRAKPRSIPWVTDKTNSPLLFFTQVERAGLFKSLEGFVNSTQDTIGEVLYIIPD